MFKMIRIIAAGSLLLISLASMAHVNPITLTLQAGATTTLSQGGTGTANYLATLNPAAPGALTLALTSGLPSGVTQVTTGTACGDIAACASTFNLTPGGSCCLRLLMTGSNMALGSNSIAPIVQTTPTRTYSGQGDTLNVTVTGGAANLSVSPSNLALSVTGLTLNGQQSGQARHLTITNTGDADATNVTVTFPDWTLNSVISAATTCGASLAPNAQCTITVTPDATATSSCNTGIAPAAQTITISADGVTPVTSNVAVLNYGCIYQDGFVFAMVETADPSQSIGGTVAAQTDQAAPFIDSGSQSTSIIWGSNGAGAAQADVSVDIIPGIDENSTINAGSPAYSDGSTTTDTFVNMYNALATDYYTYSTVNPFQSSPFNQCNGATEGFCNQGNIYTYYSQLKTNYDISGTSPFAQDTTQVTLAADYAAGLCNQYNGGTYSDWYLPAICEMGPNSNGSGCVVGTQNMQNQLSFLLGDPGAGVPSTSCNPPNGTECLAGVYWSSTEASGNPQNGAWYEYFSSGGIGQDFVNKAFQLGVRCSRALTP